MAHQKTVKGWVFKIQRHALHDGPGIRTLVFLKGCPLKCVWCFNPESHSMEPQILRYPDKCLSCGACLEVCPVTGALEVQHGAISLQRELCNSCGLCAEACPSEAIRMEGEAMSVDRVVDEVLKDRVFYQRSGGGLTLSGGEVALQAEFAAAVLQSCRSLDIHTAIETSGYAPWSDLNKIIPFTDLVLYDLKMMDPIKHREFTGCHNQLILNNLHLIGQSGCQLVIRIPFIPGYNDSHRNLNETASFIKESLPEVRVIHLLPYELIGVSKYERLGRMYALEHLRPPAEQQVQEASCLLESHGFKVKIKG